MRLLLVLLLASATVAPVQGPRTVLTVHWSAEDFPSTPLIDESIRQVLLSHTAVPVDYFAEYLESDRFPSQEAEQALRDYINRKFNGRRIDVVLAVSDPALEFVLRHRAELFPDAPVVASLSNVPDPQTLAAGAGLTGVAGGVAYDKTLDLALRLQPNTKRVFVIAYAPATNLIEQVQSELKPFSSRVELTFLSSPSVERTLEQVRAVPADSLVLYIRHSREDHGRVLFPPEIARMVSEASPVPVYGVSDTYLGMGVVGGVAAFREQLGNRLGEMALQILRGARAQDVPMEPVSLTAAIDWRQLTRWRIDPSLIPPGTDIRFRQPTPWQIYRGYIFGAMALFVVQSGLIGGLLLQRARRRRAEAALRESEAHFRIMADTAPVLIWRSGTNKQRDFVNLPWLRFTGRTLQQELGTGWMDSVHPDDRPGCLAASHAAFDAREPFRMEYRLRRFDGEYRWMLDTGVPRWEAYGMFAGYIGSCLDFTDRKQAEAALQETHAELSRVSRLTALGEFAASIAHEVRQPLTAIIMNARSCLHSISGASPDVDEVRAGMLDIVEAGQRAEEVIQRNRELFRSHSVQTTALDINRVIEETVVLAGRRLLDNHVTLVTTLGEDLPPINGDRIELQQVLLNLFANAIDAMERVEPDVRRVQVSSSPIDHAVKISVTDNGVGLGDVDVERMFSLSYTTKVNGTGVGLSISRSIIEAHGGRLWAEPNPGPGATFCFTLPVRHAAVVSPPSSVRTSPVM